MQKTDFKPKEYTLTLTIYSEDGKCSVESSINALTDMERKFLFKLMQATKFGGSVGFGAQPNESGDTVLSFTLIRPTKPKPVTAAVHRALTN